MGIGLILYPLAQNVYPQLLIYRLIFALGAAASGSMITAILADYINENDKGKVSGLVGTFSGLGAILGAFILIPLPIWLKSTFNDDSLSLRMSFFYVGIFALVFSFFLIFSLRSSNDDFFSSFYAKLCGYRRAVAEDGPHLESSYSTIPSDVDQKETSPDSDSSIEKIASSSVNNTSRNESIGCTLPGVLEQTSMYSSKPFWSLIWIGLQKISSPYIFLSYLGGFVARGDSIVITLFLPLWIQAFYQDTGVCMKDAIEDKCHEATIKTQIYSGIAQTCTLIGAPLFGFLSDKLKRRSWALLIASLVSFLGYFLVFFIPDPVNYKQYMFPLLVLIGFGEIGMIVTSLSILIIVFYIRSCYKQRTC
jgi:MFS family permease